MLGKNEELQFVEELCQKLESEALGNVNNEAELTACLYSVINDWKNTTSYKDMVQVWNDRFMMERFSAFNRLWWPDISIQTKEKPSFIAVELELGHKGNKGAALKSGIGQAIIYSNIYDYTILFCLLKVGCVPEKHEHDERIKSGLWDKHKIKVIIRYEPS
jgi:hypothetical protein